MDNEPKRLPLPAITNYIHSILLSYWKDLEMNVLSLSYYLEDWSLKNLIEFHSG